MGNLLNRSLGKLIVRVEAKILIIFTDMLGKSITTAVVTLSDNVKIVSLPPWILFRLESVFGMDWNFVESTPNSLLLYMYFIYNKSLSNSKKEKEYRD